MKRSFVAILIVSISILIGLSWIVIWSLQSNVLIERNFEIAVISQSGNPLSGVEIDLNSRIVGKTGAFGTWRGRLQINNENKFKAIKISSKDASELIYNADSKVSANSFARLNFIL
ncbi:MAG: hypothetical protein KBD78_13865 [Oligoflexales bacterium]|nr:hypothetical protein [Oligoflexales bacterium]